MPVARRSYSVTCERAELARADIRVGEQRARRFPRYHRSMSTRPTFTARDEPDEAGVWCMTADCGEHGTALTQGRTLDEARARTREAIACLLDVEEDAFDVAEQIDRRPSAG